MTLLQERGNHRIELSVGERSVLWVIQGGIFAVLFIPLLVSTQTFFPFIVFKNVVFRIIVEIMFALYFLLALRQPRFRPKKNLFMILITLFFLQVTLSSFFGIGWYRSFWGNYERMGGVFRMWHVFAFFLIASSVVTSRRTWNAVLTVSIFVSVVMSFVVLSQKLGVESIVPSSAGSRLTGTIGNPAYLAVYILFHLFFLLYFFFRDQEFRLKIFVWCVIVFDAFLVGFDFVLKMLSGKTLLLPFFENVYFLSTLGIFHLMLALVWFFQNQREIIKYFIGFLFIFEILVISWTQTRGAAVGFFIGILVCIVFGWLFNKNTKQRIILSTAGVLLFMMPFLIYFGRDTALVKGNEMLSRLSTISPRDITTESRLLVWEAVWRGWTENIPRFLFGYGEENVFFVFNRHFPPEIYKDRGSRVWFDRAHNIFLDIGVSNGIIGLVLYILFFSYAGYIIVRTARQEKSPSLVIFLGLLSAYLVQNMFVFDTLNTLILFYLVLAFILFLHISNMKAVSLPFPRKHSLKKYRIVPAVFLVFVICAWAIYVLNIKLLWVNEKLLRAIQESQTADIILDQYPEKAEFFDIYKMQENFLAAINEAVTGRYEARQHFAQSLEGLKGRKGIGEQAFISVVQTAQRELQKNIAEEPHNVRHYIFLGRLYHKFMDVIPQYAEREVELMTQAVQLSPQRPHIYFERGWALLRLGETEKALLDFQKGISLSPAVKESRLAYIRVLISVGRFDEALREIQYIQEKLPNRLSKEDYLQIIDLYENFGKNDIISLLYEYLLQEYPEAEFFARYALFYASIGENQRAEEVIRRAVEINPSYKKEIQKYLNQFFQPEQGNGL